MQCSRRWTAGCFTHIRMASGRRTRRGSRKPSCNSSSCTVNSTPTVQRGESNRYREFESESYSFYRILCVLTVRADCAASRLSKNAWNCSPAIVTVAVNIPYWTDTSSGSRSLFIGTALNTPSGFGGNAILFQ